MLLPLSGILGLFRIVVGRGRTTGTIGISLGTSEAEANRSNRFRRKSRYSSSLPEIVRVGQREQITILSTYFNSPSAFATASSFKR